MSADQIDPHGHIEDAPAVDLTELDPTVDGDAFARKVDGVLTEAGFELARRRKRAGLFGSLPSQWGRVAWPAAAAVALASLAVLRTSEPAFAMDDVTVEEEMALSVGVPEALAVWVSEPDSPELNEILIGWEQDE